MSTAGPVTASGAPCPSGPSILRQYGVDTGLSHYKDKREHTVRTGGCVIRYQLHIGLISFLLQLAPVAPAGPFCSMPCAMLEIQIHCWSTAARGSGPFVKGRANKRAGICRAPEGRTTTGPCPPCGPRGGSGSDTAPGGVPRRAESCTERAPEFRPCCHRHCAVHQRTARNHAVLQQGAGVLDWPHRQQRVPLP